MRCASTVEREMMRFIQNFLAIIGTVTIILGVGGYIKARLILAEFDRQMPPTYLAFVQTLLKTKDPGNAMVLVVPVQKGLSINDVKDSLKSLASDNNLLYLGESELHRQVEAVTKQKYRHISFMSFCSSRAAKMMADYNNVYTAFMPCRVAVVRGKNGELELHTMRLDILLHGGQPLPRDLYTEVSCLWRELQTLMHGAANGNF